MGVQMGDGVQVGNHVKIYQFDCRIEYRNNGTAMYCMLNMESIIFVYKQLLHAIQVKFQQVCILQLGKFKKIALTARLT